MSKSPFSNPLILSLAMFIVEVESQAPGY